MEFQSEPTACAFKVSMSVLQTSRVIQFEVRSVSKSKDIQNRVQIFRVPNDPFVNDVKVSYHRIRDSSRQKTQKFRPEHKFFFGGVSSSNRHVIQRPTVSSFLLNRTGFPSGSPLVAMQLFYFAFQI